MNYTFNIVKLGDITSHTCQIDGDIFTRLTPVLKLIGYTDGTISKSIKNWAGSNIKKIEFGKTEAYFINKNGIDQILSNTSASTPFHAINTIYKCIFNTDIVKETNEPYIYKYTGIQMLEIYELINEKPIKKDKVLEKLRKGRIFL